MAENFFYPSDDFEPGLSPPRRHELLRLFLEQTGALHSFLDTTRGQYQPVDRRVLALVDDRCDPCLQITGIAGSAAFLPVRPWESEEYMRRPPEGLYTRFCGVDAEMLYKHLNRDRTGRAERRIIYLVDMTPLACLALISTVNYFHLPQIRGFTLEFHLPHYVLRREDDQLRDDRLLRKHRRFRLSGQDAIYEVQLSLVVFGVDEFFWTAYFCEDAYFRASNPITEHLKDKGDGPSSGARMSKFPIWDPRYYFLSILVIRMGQITMEWAVLMDIITGHLDKHDDLFLEDDPSLRKTKEYTWILVTLRRLRNLLARVIATLVSFDTNNSVYFDLQAEGALYDRFRECFDQVRQLTAELASTRMILEQRIETLEKMSDVLVNASSLAESITATRQGDNIRLLTYISIIYLPVTLVTGIFSMNQVSGENAWWKYWLCLICFTAGTISMAFGVQIVISRWRYGRGKHVMDHLNVVQAEHTR
ncbi:tumor suppressor protein LOH1CR12 [Penicillium cosmopolitanum]|uniref:Tumor suppressor protein LOH1CR12 n=1 Tax=Penicillium cosmopolitanum TaxID=1131564 RepID=A0A9X0B9C7_9EURO|nr:tumor suppressor protein LOH1CR12 [Penicillium cosmopolitanum]KAJ5396514.1 tumor suppressor protein LOH1CR12 [Penicillium cosmopolitanum]